MEGENEKVRRIMGDEKEREQGRARESKRDREREREQVAGDIPKPSMKYSIFNQTPSIP